MAEIAIAAIAMMATTTFVLFCLGLLRLICLPRIAALFCFSRHLRDFGIPETTDFFYLRCMLREAARATVGLERALLF
jgi:hypothetical protein